jgi:hypothetical protein
MGLTISLNKVSFLPPTVRNNIFYEIETSSTRLYNTGLGAQFTGGEKSPFWRKIFKNDGNVGFGSPYFPPPLIKSGSVPGVLWKKIIGPYIWVSSIEAPSSYHLRWCRKWSRAHARPEVASPEVVNRKWKGDNFPRFFPRGFSGTPLDSRYEQWNCESNLYRVTIALLPPMLNHFSLLNCAVVYAIYDCIFYVLLFIWFFRK